MRIKCKSSCMQIYILAILVSLCIVFSNVNSFPWSLMHACLLGFTKVFLLVLACMWKYALSSLKTGYKSEAIQALTNRTLNACSCSKTLNQVNCLVLYSLMNSIELYSSAMLQITSWLAELCSLHDTIVWTMIHGQDPCRDTCCLSHFSTLNSRNENKSIFTGFI